jgi:hypothetical protein
VVARGAHQTAYDACRRATESGTDLATELRRDQDNVDRPGTDRMEEGLRPAGHLGNAHAMTHAGLDRNAMR